MVAKSKAALVAALESSRHIDMRKVADLKPFEKNARTHSASQVQQIASSIEEFGWTLPILADDAGSITAGHGRALAAQLLYAAGKVIQLAPGPKHGGEYLPAGMVPVIDCSGWSEKQRRAYVLADNQLAANAGWDETLLRGELDYLKNGGFDIGLVGFDNEFLADLFKTSEGLTDENDAPPAEAVAVSVQGDVWILGGHRIACGSCTDAAIVDKVLAGDRPNLMVTDPPYGVKYDASWRQKAGVGSTGAAVGKVMNDDRADWREAWALFPGNVAYVWHADRFCGVVANSLAAERFVMRAQIVWVKPRFVLGRGDYHSQHEPLLYTVKEGADEDWNFVPEHEIAAYAVRSGQPGEYDGGRKQSTVWNIEHFKSETGHSTQKPVECMKRPIENNSKPGAFVYEPFSGSGTTIIAGEITGRRVLAIELSPQYVDVAVRRWQAFTGKTATLQGDGRSFDAVVKSRKAA